jgi:hypothetical protein
MLDGHHREPAIRSLVLGLIGGGPGASTAAFEHNRERIDELPSDWDDGQPDPDASGDLFRELRTASAERAVDLVVEMLRRGVSASSVWDGLRVVASEMLFRLRRSSVPNAQLLGVHPLTILNAFHFASRQTRRDDTRRLLLLQAASWMPLSRDLLGRSKNLSMEGPGFDGLEMPADPVSVEDAVIEADRDPVRSASMVLRVARDHDAAEDFIDHCRSLVAGKAPEHHHHKYAVAAFEESRLTDPRWSPYLLATCLSYLPTPSEPESAVTRQARAALGRLRG